mgnify:CR=1 FL=1
MTILNKVWNHHDDWAKHPCAISNLTMTWENTLTELAKQNDRGYAPNLDFNHKVAAQTHDGEYHSMFVSMHHQIACMMEYRRWGQQTVVVGPEMQKAFGDTELGKVPASHLKMPFPAFWIAFPESDDMVLWGGSPTEVMDAQDGLEMRGTGWHKVEGAYVIDLNQITEGGKNGLLIYLWGPNPIDESLREKNKALGFEQMPTDDMAHMWFTIEFDDERDIEDHIRDTFSDPLNEIFDYHPDDPNRKMYEKMSSFREEDTRAIVQKTALTATRIILNAALYMTSPKADLMGIKSTKREKLMAEAKDLRDQASRTSGKSSRSWRRAAERKEGKAKRYKPPVTWIGPNIESAITKGKTSNTPTNRKQKGHVRKGHWHMFRTGRMKDDQGMKIPNHLRTSIYHWIAPTWCGDVDDKHTKHTHAFKEL